MDWHADYFTRDHRASALHAVGKRPAADARSASNAEVRAAWLMR
jgi:hypothetical protein